MGSDNGVDKYQDRKVAGLCTRCGALAAADAQLCQPHLDDARDRNVRYARAVRQARRERDRCAMCGLPSERYRCLACLIRDGKSLPTTGSDKGVDNVQGHATRTEVDGYTRTRYHGRARRGAPGKAASDATDLHFGMSSFQRGRDALALVADQAAGLDKRGREAAELAALGQLDLARRFIEEVLERHRFEARIAAEGERQRGRLTRRMAGNLGR